MSCEMPPSLCTTKNTTNKYLPKNSNHHEFDQLPRVADPPEAERILNNLILLEHRVMLAGPSGGAAELSVDTSAGHLIGWSDGFDAEDRIVERCGREVRLHVRVWLARAAFSN